MKKVISVILSIVFLTTLCGCKRDIPVEEDTVEATQAATVSQAAEETQAPEELLPEEGAKLTFWTGDPEFGEAVAENFEAKYGVPVKVEEVGLGALDKIKLNGKDADVFMSPVDDFQDGMAAGVFLPLDDRVAKDISDRVNETGIKAVTKDGKLYGVPVSIETTCLFYNKDIVGDTPATTLEEIIEKAKDFNDPNQNKFYFLIRVGDGYKVYPILSAYGFNIFGEDGTDDNNPGFDTDEFEKGLELISQLHDIMPINSIDLNNVGYLRDEFEKGKVAYEFTGPWDVTEFKESGVNFGVTVLPTYKGRALTPFAGIQNAHISAATDYPIAAELFAQYLVSDEAAGLLYKLVNKITSLKDITKVEGLSQDPISQAFVAQFSNAFPLPSSARTSYFWTISAQVCQNVFDQALTPAEGRAKAIEDWNTSIAME